MGKFAAEFLLRGYHAEGKNLTAEHLIADAESSPGISEESS